MDLGSEQLLRANALHVSIKRLCEERPNFIAETGVITCERCGGTGLSNYGRTSDQKNFHWQPGSYCDECFAIGFKNLDKLCKPSTDGTEYICGQCYGIGCDNCRERGLVDWVDHIMGR